MVTAFVKRKTPDVGRIERAAFNSLSALVPSEAPDKTESATGLSFNEVVKLVGSVGALVGQVLDVPLNRIRPNPFNARVLYSIGAGDEMKGSISSQGQGTTAIGYPDGEDIVLIDGHRRLRAVEDLGRPTLRIEVKPRPVSDIALYIASWTANKQRKDQTPLDDALAWRRLLDRKVFLSQVDLARSLNVSESDVSRTLALATLPALLIQSLSEQPDLLRYKMLNAIREFEQAHGIDKALALIVEIGSSGLGYREVEARRKALGSTPRKRLTPISNNVQFHHAKGTLKQFVEDGRVELVLTGLAPAESLELVTQLEKLLQTAKSSEKKTA